MEAGGSSGRLVMPKFKFAENYMDKDASTEEVGKLAFVPFNLEKGKLSIGRMVGSRWESKDYSFPTRETISLVGKSMGMLGAASGGFRPQTTRVG